MTPGGLRELVPAVRESAYLNSATYGPAAQPVVDAIARFTSDWSRGAVRFEVWEQAGEDCRRLFASLLHAPVEDVAIQPFVSTAAGSLAVQLEPGQKVVVSDLEFTSNLWPWLFQRDRGVEVVVVPSRDGRSSAEDFAAAAGGRCAIVAVSAFQSGSGWRAPLAELARIAHDAGGLLFVDACQGAGGIDLDPARDGFDVLVTDSYKWLMGPRGAGYMYIAEPARDRFRPVAMGWRSARRPRESYYGTAMDLSPTASRFDSSLSWLAMVGDREALTLLEAIGTVAVERHNLALAERFRAGLERIGIATDPFSPAERSPVMAIDLGDAEPAIARLTAAGVIAARRGELVRFSFHAFNNERDVDRALEVVEGMRRD